jgi:hypothetical protein
VKILDYPAESCECELEARRWNGYGTCLRCGGGYVVESGPLVPIVIPQPDEERPS